MSERKTFGERPFTPHEDAVVGQMLRKGWSYNQIAQALGRVSGPSVRAHVMKRRSQAEARTQTIANTKRGRNRACMRCRKSFWSAHAGVRMCRDCREYAAGVSPMEPELGSLLRTCVTADFATGGGGEE